MKVQEAVASIKGNTKIKWTIQAGLVNYIHQTCVRKIPDWNVENTADMIDYMVGYTKQSLKLAAAMQEYPTLYKIKQRSTALKIISEDKDKNIIALKIKQKILEENERNQTRTRRKPVTSEEKRGMFFAIRANE